ncbi:unnamed protein product [Cochlearia groenlandica]
MVESLLFYATSPPLMESLILQPLLTPLSTMACPKENTDTLLSLLTKPSSSVSNDYVPAYSFPPFTTIHVPQSVRQSPLVSLDNQSFDSDTSQTTTQQSAAPIVLSPTPLSSASEGESHDQE